MAPKDDDYEYTKEDLDNHSDQLNPNNDAYWQSRGDDERPDDWEDQSDDDCGDPGDDCGDDQSWD